MVSHKPIIGVAGGIGSGKSFVAKLLGEMGCRVIASDDLVHEAYQSDELKQTLRQWWGERIFNPAGEVDRSAVAGLVFRDPAQRRRLEDLVHPIVEEKRRRIMAAEADRPEIVAFVWDVPLLFEIGLNRRCDAVIFVDAPAPVRDQRLAKSRGWSTARRLEREKLQMPLDKKKKLSDYIVSNASGAAELREHVQDVLRQILNRFASRPEKG